MSLALTRLIAAIALIALIVSSLDLAAQEPFDLDVLIDRLATYLQSYEPQLSEVVADERYTQSEYRRGFNRTRTTEAEILFLRLPGEAEWFGVRDVKKVDRKNVAGTGVSLAELFTTPSTDAIAKAAAIVEASSKYNLGGRRTINMPTVPLEALSVRNHPRFIFKVAGKARIEGVRTVRITFEEFDEPTLVQSTDGGTLWSRGTAWIAPETGALWRAELIVAPTMPGRRRRPDLEARIRVDFTQDVRLNLIVPKRMEESFWIPGGVGSGAGTYSNYRRFGTFARLIP
jgi:hypothetical protein